MAQEKKRYRVKRMFGYQKPMQPGEEVLLTDFEAVRYAEMLEPLETPVKVIVNEIDRKPDKKLSSQVGRRKSK